MSSVLAGPSSSGTPTWNSRHLVIHIFMALLVIGGLIAVTLLGGQHFVYPLDDTYIHMVLAKTLATSGVWGIDPQTPVAASSSPLWTVLLAAVYLTLGWLGESLMLYTPLLLNMVFVVALICLNARILQRAKVPGNWPLAATWLFSALPSVAAIGMEHVAHAFFVTFFLYQASRSLALEEGAVNQHRGQDIDWALAALAALAATSRYESVFIIGPVVLYGLWRGMWKQAAAMALATALPLVAFGLLWVHGGGWMVPNALLLKGASAASASPGLASWLSGVAHNAIGNLTARPAMVSHAISLIHLILCWRNRAVALPVAFFSRVTLLGVVAHILLASFGWLFRYDAWLIQLNLLSIFMLLAHRPRNISARSAWVLTLLCFAVLSLRLAGASIKTPMAMEDRRWEHIMPSDFAHQYLQGRTVLVNDLGVLAYRGGLKVVDFFGLGNNEPLRMRRSVQGYGALELSELAHEVDGDAAIVQLCWEEVSLRMPSDWKLIGYWRGDRNVVFNDKVVALFSLKPKEDEMLARAFEQFVPAQAVQTRGRAFAQQFNQADTAKRHIMLKEMCAQ